jgi:hypothetical protein
MSIFCGLDLDFMLISNSLSGFAPTHLDQYNVQIIHTKYSFWHWQFSWTEAYVTFELTDF